MTELSVRAEENRLDVHKVVSGRGDLTEAAPPYAL